MLDTTATIQVHVGKHVIGAAELGKENTMSYQPYTPNTPLTTPPVQNPHSPAQSGYRQQPVDIPGVLDQTRKIYQPYQPQKDNK